GRRQSDRRRFFFSAANAYLTGRYDVYGPPGAGLKISSKKVRESCQKKGPSGNYIDERPQPLFNPDSRGDTSSSGRPSFFSLLFHPPNGSTGRTQLLRYRLLWSPRCRTTAPC